MSTTIKPIKRLKDRMFIRTDLDRSLGFIQPFSRAESIMKYEIGYTSIDG